MSACTDKRAGQSTIDFFTHVLQSIDTVVPSPLTNGSSVSCVCLRMTRYFAFFCFGRRSVMVIRVTSANLS